MSAYEDVHDGNGGGLRFLSYRVGEMAKTLADLVTWRREVDLERQRLRDNAGTLAEEMRDLKKSVDTLRKTILGFTITIAVSAIGFALTIIASGGRP